VVVLPNKKNGLAKLEKKLLTTSLTELLQRATIQTVELYLPRFKIETTLDLEKSLGKVKYCLCFNNQFGLTLGAIFSDRTVRNFLQ
jgi:serine protease inhibitor